MRISFGGGGTDIPTYYRSFGGFILSAAIDKYLYICANRPAADDLIRVKYSRYEEVAHPSEIQHDLIRPALELLGIDRNVEIASMADVPGGTGLGSSGTYLVALLTALYGLKREQVPRQALAELASHVEMDLAGHAVGKHDHYLAAFGGITCLDIESDGQVHVSPLDISAVTAEELRSRTLLFFTGITRSASMILEAQGTDTMSGKSEVLDSLHQTKDIGLRAKHALERGDLDAFGALLHEHWEAKKRRSNLISEPRIDRWYRRALETGALGGKIVGAGGGGFLMIHAPTEKKAEIRQALAEEGLREMSYQYDFDGAKIVVNV